jgi:ParB/RepB/Spo0J family partition protein
MYQEIKTSLLKISEQNIRKDYEGVGDSDATISDLANSISSQGLLNPISVRKTEDGNYDVFAGQRRFLAVKKLEWERIPCIVFEGVSDSEAFTRSLIENYHRKDNTYEEKIKAFENLYIRVCDKDVGKLSKMVGLSEPTVKRYLKLVCLPSEILSKLDTREGKKGLTLNNACNLVGLDPEDSIKIVNETEKCGLSSEQVDKVIREIKSSRACNEEVGIETAVEKVLLDLAKKRDLIAPNHPWIFDPENETIPIQVPLTYMPLFYKLYLECTKK